MNCIRFSQQRFLSFQSSFIISIFTVNIKYISTQSLSPLFTDTYLATFVTIQLLLIIFA